MEYSEPDLLRNGTWKGNPLTPEQLEGLAAEATQFQKSFLWKVLKGELQHFAIKTLMEKGETAEDIRIARVFGNIVQQIDLKLNEIK